MHYTLRHRHVQQFRSLHAEKFNIAFRGNSFCQQCFAGSWWSISNHTRMSTRKSFGFPQRTTEKTTYKRMPERPRIVPDDSDSVDCCVVKSAISSSESLSFGRTSLEVYAFEAMFVDDLLNSSGLVMGNSTISRKSCLASSRPNKNCTIPDTVIGTHADLAQHVRGTHLQYRSTERWEFWVGRPYLKVQLESQTKLLPHRLIS